MKRRILILAIVFKSILPFSAAAALNCSQLVAVAQTTISLRDQGHSLTSVLGEIERGEVQQNLNAQELNLLRQIVSISFTSEFSPREILEACKSGSLGIPKPKPER